jgi:hypothetical protein
VSIRDADLGFFAFGASMFYNSLSICLFLSDADEVEGFRVFIEAPKAKKPKSASLIDTIKQNHMDYRKFITKKCPRS